MSKTKSTRVIDTMQTSTVVVGAGIAGCWTAIKLLRMGIPTVVIHYDQLDRGGKLGASKISAGAINTSSLTKPDYSQWLDNLGYGQGNLNIADIITENLTTELEELKAFDPLKKIALGVSLKSGSGHVLLKRLFLEIRNLGGKILNDTWITRMITNGNICQGVQYQQKGSIGAIRAQHVVLASGGYASLFQGAVKSGTYGSMHGRMLMAGGILSNMEFVFKHGYGQPDLGMLTPTEELPGAEIYDQNGIHLEWLEKELFYERGTNNHFQALLAWRKGDGKKYFVDFRYREVHKNLKKLSAQVLDTKKSNIVITKLLGYANKNNSSELLKLLNGINDQSLTYDFELFSSIKKLICDHCKIDRSKIRQISYFSMGGIAHHQFQTSFKNVFVCGEAMHDFGAFRIGGLPWALYLCAAKIIAQHIWALKLQGNTFTSSIDLEMQFSNYDESILKEVQIGLQQYQESNMNQKRAVKFTKWIKDKRLSLLSKNQVLDDAVAYLTTSEAIMRSSIIRQESRGCFFRDDFPEKDVALDKMNTISKYNHYNHDIIVELVDHDELTEYLSGRKMNFTNTLK